MFDAGYYMSGFFLLGDFILHDNAGNMETTLFPFLWLRCWNFVSTKESEECG